jgi:hypothetical protein
MGVTIKFYDADGNEVLWASHQLVTSITASAEQSQYFDGAGVKSFFSITETIPTGMVLVSEKEMGTMVDEVAGRVDNMCKREIERRMAIIRSEKEAAVASRVSRSTDTNVAKIPLQDHAGDPETPVAKKGAVILNGEQTVPYTGAQAGRRWSFDPGRDARMPNGEALPGDWWVLEPTGMMVGYGSTGELIITLYREGLKYSVATIREKDPAWTTASSYAQGMEPNNAKHPFRVPVYLVQQVSTKRQDDGTGALYVNNVRLTTVDPRSDNKIPA